MKRATVILVGAMCMSFLFACQKNKPLQPSEISETQINADKSITMATEYACYGQDAPKINVTITNHSDTDTCAYGVDYLIQKQEDGEWKDVPFREEMAWIEIACLVLPGQTSSQTILLSDLDYAWTAGSYRVVKHIQDRYYAAAFEIGTSKITADTPFGFAALETLDKAYTAEDAAGDGVVVFGLNGSENAASVVSFLDNVLSGTAAMLRVGRVSVEGDLLLTDVIYNADGMDGFLCRTDSTRDAFSGEPGIVEMRYSYLITDGDTIYLSDYAQWNDATVDDSSALLFTGDDETSPVWVSLVEEMTQGRKGAGAIGYKVFSPDGTWWACLTDLPLEFGYSNSEFGAMQDITIEDVQPTKINCVNWVSDTVFVLSCSTERQEISFFAVFDVSKRAITFTGYGSAYTNEKGVIRIAP